jgi:type I restriction enzyme, S subunit
MVIAAQGTGIKQGYKLTEVGVIPEDWKIKPLGEIASISSGGTPDRLNPTYWGGDIPWVTTTQINFNSIDIANELITRKGLENSAARIYNPGTLLMAMYGQGKTRGKVAVLAISAAINQACAAIKINKGISSQYVFFNLSSRYEEIRSLSNTGNQENLNAEIIKNILIPLPKEEKEQHAIATSLSDVDALIASLDKLIAKKRDIKQATMQQLLTGMVRLPGFSREWEVKKLGELIEFTNGKPYEKFVRDDGRYCLITLDSISIDGKIKEEHKRIDFFDDSLCKNDIVIILSDIAHGNFLGLCDLIPEDNKYVLNQRVGRLKTIATINPKFLSLLINYNQDHFKKRGQGTSQRHIYKRDIEELSILIPKFEEQTTIAIVLSDMDAEIAALEQRRDKTRALKQGMMQELLTGKTRLL